MSVEFVKRDDVTACVAELVEYAKGVPAVKLPHDVVAGGSVINSASITTYSAFALASFSFSNPLPVALVTFDAFPHGNQVHLSWTTASQNNNDYFTIERSADGIAFNEVANIDAAANGNQIINYSLTDQHPYNGTSYYRLKQIDFNGKFTYTNMEAVTMKDNFDYSIFPNPSQGTNTFISIHGTKDDNINVSVYDDIGRVVFSKSIIFDQTESNTVAIETAHKLASGLYSVIIKSNQKSEVGKLIVN